MRGGGQGNASDSASNLAALRFSCTAVVSVTKMLAIKDDGLVRECRELLPRLAEPSLDAAGAIAPAEGQSFDGSTIEFAYQVFPFALWTRFDHPEVVARTADAMMRKNCTAPLTPFAGPFPPRVLQLLCDCCIYVKVSDCADRVGADWCLLSDGVPDPRVQARNTASATIWSTR